VPQRPVTNEISSRNQHAVEAYGMKEAPSLVSSNSASLHCSNSLVSTIHDCYTDATTLPRRETPKRGLHS
jgi:hypothetical protein